MVGRGGSYIRCHWLTTQLLSPHQSMGCGIPAPCLHYLGSSNACRGDMRLSQRQGSNPKSRCQNAAIRPLEPPAMTLIPSFPRSLLRCLQIGKPRPCQGVVHLPAPGRKYAPGGGTHARDVTPLTPQHCRAP